LRGCDTLHKGICAKQQLSIYVNCRRGRAPANWDNTGMLLVALIGLSVVVSLVLRRHLIIRAGALVLLSLMLMLVLLCVGPAFRLVDWIRPAA
jgi:hypothetical protein